MCNRNQLMEIANYGNGRYVRIRYKTNMDSKLSAASKRLGIHAEKITETTVRVGSAYGHMQSVIDRRAKEGEPKEYKDNYEWVIPNKVKRHKEKGTEYLVCGTMPHPNKKTTFVIYNGADDVRTTKSLTDEQKALFIPSAFNHGDSVPEVYSVKLDDLLMFNKVF